LKHQNTWSSGRRASGSSSHRGIGPWGYRGIGAICALAASIAATPLRAADSARLSPGAAPPTIAAVAIASPADAVTLDGHLSDAVWSKASAVSEFLQRDPSEGAPATHPTDVRVAYDGSAVYVAIKMMEPERDRLVGMLTRRDDGSPSDWIRIFFDSYRDRRTAYEFAVNAAGVKQDKYWFADNSNDGGWDAVWDVAVQKAGDHWTAEFRVPFSQLRFDPRAAGTFGFAVMRTVAHVNETSTWPLLARSASGFVSSFGELTGLAFPSAAKRLELLPYLSSSMTSAPVAPGNPLRSSPEGNLAAGLDLKYRMGGLTLTGTINPDFGQVEADPAVVNLGAFETFFAERRPFFVEGSGNFSFNIDCNDGQCTGLFYSRRIGRAPQRFAPAPDGGFADQPTNSTILGAAKITGRVGRFSIGVLNAVTGSEEAKLTAGPGAPVLRSPVEPLTSYTVGRASREFANRSRLSFAMTHTARDLPTTLAFLPSSAVTGGMDGDWRLGSKYSVTGFWAASRVAGTGAAIDRLQRSNVHSFQRPDADHLDYDPTRDTLGGYAGSISVNKISGQTTRFNSYVGFKSPGFDINDLGFFQRADEVSQGSWFQLRSDRPGRFFRNASVNFNQWAGWNFGGDLRFKGANVNTHFVMLSNWNFGGGVSLNGQGLADRLTRGGPAAYSNANINGWSYLGSDNRRLLSMNLNVSAFADRHDSRTWDVSPSVVVRPTRALAITIGGGYGRAVNQSQWVANLVSDGRPRYVFGRIDQTTTSLSARVNYTLSPTLSLQMYARPFVSAGDYDRFKELANSRARDYDSRYAPFAYTGNPDFNIRSFRTTNVLRWEYRPGSAIFLVWQQGRDGFLPSGTFEFSRDFGGVFETPATNLFLVKVSHWLNW
jgi:hypothetical protein